MTSRLRWTTGAAADLQEHLEYILERNPPAAARLAERVFSVEQTIRRWTHAAPFGNEPGVYMRWISGSRLS